MADRLLRIIGHQALELGLSLFVFQMRRPGPRKDCSKLRPGIRGTHIDNSHCFDTRLRRLDPEKGGWLAAFDASPEFALGSNNQVLVKRIGTELDFNPLATAGNDRKDRRSRRYDPHVMLNLRSVFFDSPFLRE